MAITIKSGGHLVKKLSTDTDYSAHLGFKQVTGSVNVEKKHASQSGGAIQATTQIPVHKAISDGCCRVGCSGARTINLGNYESVKIGVWLEMPCTKDDIASTYDFVTDWVGEQLTAAVAQTKE